ncbi:alpha-L-arabinofuranosidase [Flavobacterium restrictum]|uniref:Alpha-L-arabinofuranosidase n=1 Tax=Flavobacterium restrictum TaxID=2594428 RepID=A0A553DZZ6_9FLAO|nr:alpha-L-arabinofuranosidase [Flavobacterium restrictum]TRX38374.1 alpha-L-arabinofuranosidase [Flavobacterium restrictum]
MQVAPSLISKITYFILAGIILFSCSNGGDSAIPITPTPTPDVITTPADPAVASTVGFFLDNWQAKQYVPPTYVSGEIPSAASTTVTIDATSIIAKIPTTIFGQNGNNWSGKLNEASFITDLTNLQPHIVRLPGGSGSDAYFWNAVDATSPGVPDCYIDKEGKKQGFTYGKTQENWRPTVDDYYAMLSKSNSKSIITCNYGYARYGTGKDPVMDAAKLAADWVAYDNGRTEYWEIGNESYADWEAGYRIDVSKNQDGQPELLTGKLYAQHFKIFAREMRKAAKAIGKVIKIGAVMQESPIQSYQVETTKTWNATMLPEINNQVDYTPDYYIVHNYITPYNENSAASTILKAATTVPAEMMAFVTNELKINNVATKPFAFTEWNMWAKDSKQQVSNNSGLFAVIVQAEAIKNKYGLAARWDLANAWENGNDHGLFSRGEPGIADWTPRPSFYHMYYFQKCLGDRLVPTTVAGNQNIKAYASTYTTGQSNVTVLNTSGTAQNVEIKTKNLSVGTRYYWYSLAGENDNGEFSRKVKVNDEGTTNAAGGPQNYATLKAKSAVTTNGIKVTVPAWGSVYVMIDKK